MWAKNKIYVVFAFNICRLSLNSNRSFKLNSLNGLSIFIKMHRLDLGFVIIFTNNLSFCVF